jgi:hypothetical protein
MTKRISGLSPLDVIKNAKAEAHCDVCDEPIVVWADDDEMAEAIADAWVVHIVDEHMQIEIDYDTEIGVADMVAGRAESMIESGRVERRGDAFVVTDRDE